jgi:trans-2,3-dihydro-3-hydroxyanthranilate isomerase
MRRRFATLDVFTDRRFAGNPLAVVLESESLDAAAMQAIAREFNAPETVFVRPPADPRHRAAMRIFTPARELPFAGHPTLGAAVLLAEVDGGAGARDVVLETGIGAVACEVEPVGGGHGRGKFDLAKLPEQAGQASDDATIAAALGLAPEDIGFDNFVPAQWSAGNAFTFVPLRSRAAVDRCRPDLARWDTAFASAIGAFVFCGEAVETGHAFNSRMFAPRFGIPEDPASGSAVAALAGMIAARTDLADGDHEFGVEQGYAMGRPSLITLGMTIRDGKLVAASIGGHAVLVSEGTIEA